MEGIHVIPSDAFQFEGQAPNYIRISLGRAKDRIEPINALRGLADLLNRDATMQQREVVV